MGFCRGVSAFFVCFVSAAVGFFGQSGVFSFLVFALGGKCFPEAALLQWGRGSHLSPHAASHCWDSQLSL